MRHNLLIALTSALSLSTLAFTPGANAQSSLLDAPGFDPSIPPVMVDTPIYPSSPTTIFNAGLPNLDNGYNVTLAVQADDFILGSDDTLTRVNFWTLEPGDTWDGTLDYFIFADNSGEPASSPLYTGSGSNINRTATGNSALGYDEYAYSFDLPTPLTLSGATRYWLGLHLAADFSTNDNIFWQTTGGNFGSTSHRSEGGSFDNWDDNFEQLAFNLVGDTGVVPEPTTIIGSIILGGVLFPLKRKLTR